MFEFTGDILAICGPTGSGKSSLAIKIAQKYNCEIINADAFAVYKKMDIGTAKPTIKERQEVKHHLVDVFEYDEYFDVRIFQTMARALIDDILSQGKKVIIVGGSNLYLQSVLYNYTFDVNPEFEQVKKELELLDLVSLQTLVTDYKLELNNSEFNNKKRLANVVAKAKLGIDTQKLANEKYYQNFDIIAVKIPREQMYQKINDRVDLMLQQGLINEVGSFERTQVSQLAIGYKEVHMYLNEEIGYDEMVELIKKNTRHFAKRQMSWLNNQINVRWIDKEEL